MSNRKRVRWEEENARAVPLTTDGGNHNILTHVAKNITRDNIPGMTMEIGIRAGGGSAAIMKGLLGDQKRTHIGLDPYGSIDYEYTEDRIVEDAYPNRFRDAAIPALYDFCAGSNVNFLFFQMTDTQFFKRFSDGVPLYDGKEYIENTYSLVYFDGPHTLKTVMAETKFFEPRTKKGAAFVYDDVEGFYNHSKIKEYLEQKGWKQFFADKEKTVYHKMKE